MPAGVRMLARMLIGRAVTAERDAAFLARSQVNPALAVLHTLAAHTDLGVLYRRDLRKVRTGVRFRHAGHDTSWRRWQPITTLGLFLAGSSRHSKSPQTPAA